MAIDHFYAVAAGRSTGVFTTWAECEAQVKGFTGCRYKKFKTSTEAQAFINDFKGPRGVVTLDPSPNLKRPRDENTAKRNAKKTHYAITRGHKTGIVTSKEEVDKMTVGYPGHSAYMEFDTKKAALDYFAIFDNGPKQASMLSEEEKCPSSGKDTPRQSAVEADADLKTAACIGTEGKSLVTEHAAAFQGQKSDPDPIDPDAFVAFCDGSALGNGRQNCRAGYACIYPYCEEWNVAKPLVEKHVTNTRAEFMAALEAMKRANVEDPSGSRLLYIFSDSMVLIRSMTEWADAWQKNHWTKSDGKPVKNRDLLELLMVEKGDRCICWNHVKAHTGKTDWKSKWNDVADKAARNAALGAGKV